MSIDSEQRGLGKEPTDTGPTAQDGVTEKARASGLDETHTVSAIEQTEEHVRKPPSSPSSDPQAPENWIGKVVAGAYRIERLLGRGGMGSVFLAHQMVVDRPVALKVIDPRFAKSATHLKRFQREARTMARLNHRNIVAVYDAGLADEDLLYIAMEYVKGVNLDDIRDEQGALGETRALRITAQVVEALIEAHALGIIHRDLKPANILVTQRRGISDIVKVADFGIAKWLNPPANEPRLTDAGIAVGSPAFMAPEQIVGAPVDGRTDIYSLGLVLFQMLTGKDAFAQTSVQHIMEERIRGEMPRVSLSFPELAISSETDEMLSRCLERRPERRFPSARHLKTALSEISQTLNPPAVRKQQSPQHFRTRIPTLMPAMLGVVVLAVIAIIIIQARPDNSLSLNGSIGQGSGAFLEEPEQETIPSQDAELSLGDALGSGVVLPFEADELDPTGIESNSASMEPEAPSPSLEDEHFQRDGTGMPIELPDRVTQPSVTPVLEPEWFLPPGTLGQSLERTAVAWGQVIYASEEPFDDFVQYYYDTVSGFEHVNIIEAGDSLCTFATENHSLGFQQITVLAPGVHPTVDPSLTTVVLVW